MTETLPARARASAIRCSIFQSDLRAPITTTQSGMGDDQQQKAELLMGQCNIQSSVSGRWLCPFGAWNVHASLEKPEGLMWVVEPAVSLFPLSKGKLWVTSG